jgi:hypothetical protein
MSGASGKEVADALQAHNGDLARELLGEPNRELSTPTRLRFGPHGSIAVELEGKDARRWFDHAHGIGGAGIELLQHRRGLGRGAALDWSRQWLGMPTSPRWRKPDPPSPPAAPTSDASDADRPEDAPPPWRDPDGCEAVPHGFRAAFSTSADETRPHEREAAERALAHQVGNELSGAYRRSNLFDRRIALMADWAAHCTGPSRTGIARRGVIQ